jgi:hypothetical protein
MHESSNDHLSKTPEKPSGASFPKALKSDENCFILEESFEEYSPGLALKQNHGPDKPDVLDILHIGDSGQILQWSTKLSRVLKSVGYPNYGKILSMAMPIDRKSLFAADEDGNLWQRFIGNEFWEIDFDKPASKTLAIAVTNDCRFLWTSNAEANPKFVEINLFDSQQMKRN